MEQRVSLITLGVSDLARARDFYAALGWRRQGDDADVVFFQTGGMALALWDRDKLAEDSGLEAAPPPGGAVLAHNVRSPAEVDEVVAAAEAAGARVTRAPAETFWGGYSGVFLDPDGHPWEIAHNPHWHIAADGATYVSGPPAAAPGSVVYFAVPAPDAERAQAFYRELFGWSFSGGNVEGGFQIEGADPPGGLAPEDARAPRLWFAVDDITAAAERVRELGGEAGAPTEIASGWMLAARDPNGVELNLWSGR